MSKEQSLKQRIANYFARHPDKWYNGGVIEEFALTAGYKASNASRRLRELKEENILERKIERGSVWYQLNK